MGAAAARPEPGAPGALTGGATASSATSGPTTAPRPGSASSTGPCAAWPARGSPRPRWTTSPARPGCPGPPSTGPSPGARRASSPPSSRPRWPACSRRWPSSWARRRPRGRARGGHGRVGPPAPLATSALAYLLEHEPGAVLPHLTFGELDRVLLVAGDLAAPVLRPLARARAGVAGGRVGRAHRPGLLLGPAGGDRPDRRRRRPRASSARSSCPASWPCASTPPAPSSSPSSDAARSSHRPPTRPPPRGQHNDHARRRPGPVEVQPRADRPGEDRRPRGGAEPRRAVRRRGLPPRPRQLPGRVHLGLREGRQAAARQALREGQEGAVERPDRPGLVDRGRPGAGRHGQRRGQPGPDAVGRRGAGRHRAGEVGRQALHAVRDREPELAAVAVHARRAGCAALHGQDRRDGAVDRRQVLRRHPGDGRGPPRRGLLQVPRREALGPLPDERPPRAAARRHRRPTRAGT